MAMGKGRGLPSRCLLGSPPEIITSFPLLCPSKDLGMAPGCCANICLSIFSGRNVRENVHVITPNGTLALWLHLVAVLGCSHRPAEGVGITESIFSTRFILMCICLKTSGGTLSFDCSWLQMTQLRLSSGSGFSIEHLISWSRNCFLPIQLPLSWGWELGE